MRQNSQANSPFSELASKKDDSNYEQVRGHVPKNLAMQFRLACTARKMDYSEGVEAALKHWLAHLEREEQAQKET